MDEKSLSPLKILSLTFYIKYMILHPQAKHEWKKINRSIT